MTNSLSWGLAGIAGLSLALAACGPARYSRADEGQRPIMTANGVQQFAVPAEGRSLLAQRLEQLVPGGISDARISNAWRTAAAAQVKPNDYAACVSASGRNGTQIFLIVKSGPGTGDVLRGDAAAQRCSDRSKVTQWVTLPEAMS